MRHAFLRWTTWMEAGLVASALLLLVLFASCSDSTRASPTAPSSPSTISGFNVQGDPESSQGATWTYRGSLQGATFDLQGILFKPAGAGPFGAVILSHGARQCCSRGCHRRIHLRIRSGPLHRQQPASSGQ